MSSGRGIISTWDNSMDRQFLEYYRAEGCLWNPQDPHHRHVGRRNAAWRRMAQCLNAPVQELKRKKESLLSTYRKLRRETKGDEKPQWWAYEFIHDFLGDVSRSNPTSSDQEPRQRLRPMKRELEQEDMENGHEEETYVVVPPEAKRQDPLQPESVGYVRQALALLGLALNGQSEEDECELYCKLLATKLRKLPERQRYEMMHEIDGLLLNRPSSEYYETYQEEDAISS